MVLCYVLMIYKYTVSRASVTLEKGLELEKKRLGEKKSTLRYPMHSYKTYSSLLYTAFLMN